MKLSDVSVTSYHIHSNINYEKLLFEICMQSEVQIEWNLKRSSLAS